MGGPPHRGHPGARGTDRRAADRRRDRLLDPAGVVVDERLVAREAAARGFSLRTGCFCNPGAGEGAFGITAQTLQGVGQAEVHTVDDYIQFLGMPTGGAVRVSLGLVSTFADVRRLLEFVAGTYLDRQADSDGLAPRIRC